jgi:hypothetical protein
MSQTFTSVDDSVLCAAIGKARRRLVFVAPGIRLPVAKALSEAMECLPKSSIHLVLDVDAEVCRLGYGDSDLKGMEYLQAAAASHGLTVNHHPGIRIGLLIADESTLIYSPIPELIEAESRQPEKPNAILLQDGLPSQLANACGVGQEGFATVEVGNEPISRAKVEAVRLDLQDSPPKEFNVARIERVFSSKLQYVELEIKDYKLTSRSLLLRPELFGVRDAELARRLTNRYHLFSETDALRVKIPLIGEDGKVLVGQEGQRMEEFGPLSIDRERSRIKKRFVIEAGHYGSLILRRDVEAFGKEIGVLQAKIEEYQKAVQKQIESRVIQIVKELLTGLQERLKAMPPDTWQSRILGKQPTDEDIQRLFQEDIQDEVRRVRTDFEPRVFVAFKDVTYSTFKDPQFRCILEKRFGEENIARIFREYDAAPETSPRP